MPERRCPYCGEPAAEGHAGCAGFFRDVMNVATPYATEPLPPEVEPHVNDPERLARHYVLVEHAGRGGMGVVWKAWDLRLSRWVALKFLRGPLAADAARFEREARLAAKLHHPNIAGVIEFGETSAGARYLAMAYVDGPSLANAAPSPREAAAIYAKVARAVDAAHRAGVLHRDLKPGNILLSREGWPYVTDFGLAKTIDASGSLTSSGDILGTPAFMAPEQADGGPADVRSDVYALGASLYATLCGRAPFEAESALALLARVRREDPVPPRRLKPELPEALEAITLRAMRKSPDERHPSAAALAEDLERFLEGRPPAERRRSRAPAAALAFLILAAGGVALWRRPTPAPPPKPAPPLEKPRAAAPEPPPPPPLPPPDPPELDAIDLAACARAADPEADFEKVERRLLEMREPLSPAGRRKRLSALVAAGAQRRLLQGRTEAEVVRDLAAHGPALREAGGPLDPDAYGPRVARVFAGVLAR